MVYGVPNRLLIALTVALSTLRGNRPAIIA